MLKKKKITKQTLLIAHKFQQFVQCTGICASTLRSVSKIDLRAIICLSNKSRLKTDIIWATPNN